MIPKGPDAQDYRSMYNYYGFNSVLENAPDPHMLAELIYAFNTWEIPTADQSIAEESYVRDEQSLGIFEFSRERAHISAQGMGTPVREDFQNALLIQVLTGATPVGSIIEEMQSLYDSVLEEIWDVR